MNIISIKRDKHVKNRFYLKLEGRDPSPVSAETVAVHGLRAGMEIDDTVLADMLADDEKRRAMDAAFVLLSYSQRSVKELSERLRLKQFSKDAIEHVLARLSELKYLDDATLARNVLLLRRSQGKGEELIKFELKRKGVSNEIVNETFGANRLSPAEEARNVLPLAKKKLARMRGVPGQAAVHRLTGFLARRGFSLETVRLVLKLLKTEPQREDQDQ